MTQVQAVAPAPPAKSKRESVLVRFPPEVVKIADDAAAKSGLSRNEVIVEAVRTGALLAATEMKAEKLRTGANFKDPAPKPAAKPKAAPKAKAKPIPAALKGQEFATIRKPQAEAAPAEVEPEPEGF